MVRRLESHTTLTSDFIVDLTEVSDTLFFVDMCNKHNGCIFISASFNNYNDAHRFYLRTTAKI
jgi:hypothetical protein